MYENRPGQQPQPTQPVQPAQPVYQQPAYQQPVYQQPVYQQPAQPVQPAQPSESLFTKLYGKTDTLLGKLLMLLSLILFALTATCVFVGFIVAIVDAVDRGSFFIFFRDMFVAILLVANYAFMGGVLAFAKNRLDK